MELAVAAIHPFRDSSRGRRLAKVVGWLAAFAVLVLILELIGIDVTGWLSGLWDQIVALGAGYLVGGIILQIVQTTANGLAYYGIFKYGYPDQEVRVWPIVTAYAVGVAMNSFLPANIGTFVTLLMFVAIIPGSTFPGALAAYLVNKIFFTLAGGVVYVYLFLAAGDSVDVELGWLRDHPVLLLVIVVGAVFLVTFLIRIFWRWLKGLWEKAKQGGKILTSPKDYALRVVVPQTLSYAAKVGVIAVFLAAYSIPVTFDSVTRVIGSSSAANVTSVTPGAVGVTQAANVAALRDYTDSATATAYSLTQQLITSATNVIYALVLVVLIFGWTGGKELVGGSYTRARVKAKELRSSDDEADA